MSYRYKVVVQKTVVMEGARVEGLVKEAEAAVQLIRKIHEPDDKEHFWVIGLNTKLGVVGVEEVSIGGMDTTVVDARIVFRAALLMGATAIIHVHNHPSGDVQPSAEDYATHTRLQKAGQTLGIAVHDMIIIGDHTKNWWSASISK